MAVDYQTVSVVIAAASVVMGMVTWVVQSRYNNRTNQARLFMQLYSQFNTSEFNRATDEIFFTWEWADYDDFMERYGPETNMEAWSFWGAVFEYFHGVSVLVEQRLIDVRLVYELMSGPILRYWQRVEPIMAERRKQLTFPDAIDSVEYLAQEMIIIRDRKLASARK